MSPENQDELCHVLLTELLAYQFAWPVRWIETQDVLLNDFKTERYIEVGPQPILTNMAKRTLLQNADYEHATAISTRRQVLSVTNDMDKICYEYDPPVLNDKNTSDTTENHVPESEPKLEVNNAPIQHATSSSTRNSFSIQPKLSSKQIIQFIVSRKLAGYSMESLPLHKTLKELCNGKSTLQNEIKGDIYKELPSLQETQLEDLPLETVIQEVDSVSTLGPVTHEAVTRFIPRKFAGSLSNVSAVKEYLQRYWAVDEACSVLLFLASTNLEGRLLDEDATRAYIDKTCVTFANSYGISYTVASAASGSSDQIEEDSDEKPKTVDIELYNKFSNDLTSLQQKQHQVLGQHLDIGDGKSEIELLKAELNEMKGKLSAIGEEFGSDFVEKSLVRSFSPLKIRVYDSAWNWGKQSVLKLLYSALLHPQDVLSILNPNEMHNLVNRADLSIIRIIQHMLETKDYTPMVRRRFEAVISACLRDISSAPVYSATQFTALQSMTPQRKIEHANRNHDPSHYIKEMSIGKTESAAESSIVSTKLNSDMSSYYKIEKELFQVYSKIIQYSLASNNSPANIRSQFETIYEQLLIFLRNSDHVASFFRGIINEAVFSVNKTLIATKDEEQEVIVSDCEISSSDDEDEPHVSVTRPAAKDPNISIPTGVVPFLHLKRRSHVSGEWIYDKALTQAYLDKLLKISKAGISFSDKRALVLVTDAEDGLALEVINALLQAGSVVVIATQRYDRETTRALQKCYQNYGSTGSKLIVLPLNISSKLDVLRFAEYLFSNIGDIDFLLPLNVKNTPGSILDYTSEAELTHRSSSVNLLRLLGSFVKEKRKHGIATRPTHVLLPLSPNHANIYEKSNFRDTFLALVLQKWYDEDWSTELSICGCVYGWTNEDGGDLVAEGLEKFGVRTFANNEMAFNMLGLLSYDVVESSQQSPLIADLNGGLQTLPNISSIVSRLKEDMRLKRDIKLAITEQKITESELMGNKHSETEHVEPRGNMGTDFPQMKPFTDVWKQFNGAELSGLLDLSQVVVITGFAEIGPWGSARTRWEMEKSGEFSLEGCLELACIMGLIEYKNINGKSGWMDIKSQSFVNEFEIKDKYEKQILEHSGIRIIEPELFQGFDPNKKQLLHEVIITHDLSPIQMDRALAEQYKSQHESFVEVYPIAETGNSECLVKFLKGCSLMIPKALRFDRFVAGQVPTGWDPLRYGITEDIVSQVDPVTLYALVATAEALLSSGIVDPYEMYQYVHVSEVGNCSGSGIGGMKSHRLTRQARMKEDDVQNDILQETFINASAAWVNMLLLSSSGPIKTPVGACATAVESLDYAVETIMSGKAKICIAGGYDDFEEHVAYEFGNMGATSNHQKEVECGRDPREMCRPATTSRNGFMESQGAGIQVLMSAQLAIRMGVPIYGIVGMTSTASDKIGKSLPAPGKGIMTCARQILGRIESPSLNVEYRKRQLQNRLKEIKEWEQCELAEGMDAEIVKELSQKQVAEAKKHWGNFFWHKDPRISPIKGCLATFGLSIDDLGVASCHGTSTKANEKNESQILNTMMEHLNRTEGNPLLTVFQKYLTGHPKGAAGAWMVNGLLQIMQTGVIPGNRNADNIDGAFSKFEHLLYSSENIDVGTVKATCLTSFGFGQKGCMAILINPNYVLSSLSEEEYNDYVKKLNMRERMAQRRFTDGLVKQSICQLKNESPFSALDEENVYLEPLARADSEFKIRLQHT